MGFFDNIASTVSKATREVSDGVKVAADKNRIRKDISSIENEMRNRYRDIGLKFFEENRENVPADYVELFEGIIALRENLAAKQKELEAIDGTMTCTGCGKSLAKDTKFCPYCGTTAPVPEAVPAPAAAAVCPACGAPLASDALFCAACGNKLAAPAAPEVTIVSQNVCPTCGTQLEEGALFCASCGTKAPGVD